MLHIRAEQFTEMSERRKMHFSDQLEIALLGTRVKEQACAQRWAARSCIDKGMLLGRQYKLVRESDVARLVMLVWRLLGGRYAELESPAAVSILFDHRLGPDEKLDRIESWAEARVAEPPVIPDGKVATPAQEAETNSLPSWVGSKRGMT